MLAAAWVPNRGGACTTAAVLAGLRVLGAPTVPDLGAATLALGAPEPHAAPAPPPHKPHGPRAAAASGHGRGAGRQPRLGPGAAGGLRDFRLEPAPAEHIRDRRARRPAWGGGRGPPGCGRARPPRA